VIADHPRSYDTGDMVFDPLHYLPLIERGTVPKLGVMPQRRQRARSLGMCRS
jgi:hypothetical protein